IMPKTADFRRLTNGNKYGILNAKIQELPVIYAKIYSGSGAQISGFSEDGRNGYFALSCVLWDAFVWRKAGLICRHRQYTIQNPISKGDLNMDFHLTREQDLVRRMMKDFTENEVKPIAAETDETCTYPRENIDKLFDLGVMGMIV